MKKTAKTLNRIYQGRVQQVSVLDAAGKEIVCKKGDDLLFEHHRLFQDAVNYYLVALAAMSLPSETSFFGKIRKQLKEVWQDFDCKGEKRPGLKHSMIRTLGHPELLDRDDGLDAAMRLILDGNTVNPEILNDALEYIAGKCEGNVTQPSKTYFPQLCTEFTGNYDRDQKAFLEAEGKKQLLDALRSETPLANILQLIPKMELGWCGIKTQTGKAFQGEEAKQKLQKAIHFFIDNEKKSSMVDQYLVDFAKKRKIPLEEYLAKSKNIENISFNRESTHQDQNLCHAMWLLKFFPDEFTVGLMIAIIPEKESADIGEPPCWGDDPVKLSRGSRGYVFPAFTALPNWKIPWREFDMSAFSEALKTINQFRGKMQERKERRRKYEDALNWMNGKGSGNKPPVLPDSEDSEEDADSESQLSILAGDPRWNALQQLQKELGIRNDFTEGEFAEYGLSSRTIRGFQKLRTRLLSAEKDHDTKKLQEEIKRFQTENRDIMGSAALFQKLMEPQYTCIWHDLQNPGKFSSDDILYDAVRYYFYQEKAKELEKAIQVTPADAKYSRRCSDLRALAYDKKNGYQKGLGYRKDGSFAVKIVGTADGKYVPITAILKYSAPRLRRDGLIGSDFSAYYPPAVQAFLNVDDADKQDFASTAAFLMPDWDKNGKRRILLNFAASLDVTKLHGLAASRFEKQFIYANDTYQGLQWPSYQGKQPVKWCESSEPFTFISVDLGQRTAGALSRMEVTTEARPHAVQIGEGGGHVWYVYRRYSELLRLPGEDALVFRNGKKVPEYSGSEGRPATSAETDEAKSICSALLGNTDFLENYAGMIDTSFPKQNDRLLLVFRRALWRLKQLQRWLWMLKKPESQEKAQTELKECDWVPVKDPAALNRIAEQMREELQKQLIRLADRILPLRGRHWSWIKLENTQTYRLKQTEIGTADTHTRICGQRGLSFARLEQLESLRMRCQSLNRILMRPLGAEPVTTAQMREMQIPDCCPDILMRLDAMKEQRINQTANMILAQALGLRHRVHAIDETRRKENDIHGEYEKIPGVRRASFIVLENLNRYRFSQDRSSFENSRLMKWSHRQVLEKLKLLCDVFNIHVLQVEAGYSSKFSADGIPGFRAEEISSADSPAFMRKKNWDDSQNALAFEIRTMLLEMQQIDKTASVLMPRDGGPIFVPFVPGKDPLHLLQADINASFNIGIRGVADMTDCKLNQKLSAELKKGKWQTTKKRPLPKGTIIEFSPQQKLTGNGGNFFVLGCTPVWKKDGEDSPHFSDAELNRKYPNLMFGGTLWRDSRLQLERCCEINEDRLKCLKKKTKS